MVAASDIGRVTLSHNCTTIKNISPATIIDKIIT
jgi:hypothetical protein